MTVKVAINGFGRIGRNFLRIAYGKGDIDFVAINDLTDAKTLAHLLQYYSVSGIYEKQVCHDADEIMIGDERITIYSERDPAKLPWKELGVDLVIEATGVFRSYDKAHKHIEAGAKKVILSAPAKGGPVATFVMGVNHDKYKHEEHDIVSNASCTTNCLAPVAKVLHQNLGITKGIMTTIHSYTNDQRILDLPHSDLRRARAAAVSMIPTTTGAAKAVGLVLPELNGKLDGMAIRVPTPNVSLVDLTVHVGRKTTAQAVNDMLKQAAAGELKGILDVNEKPLVSHDFNGNPFSSILDAEYTKVLEDDLVKVLSWYDNEWGYSARLVDLALYMLKQA